MSGTQSTKPILFLLAPGFEDNGRREYCPECAEMWGILSYYPSIKEAVEIRYQPIAKPRADMVSLLGEEHQNCPTLALRSEPMKNMRAVPSNGYFVINNARDIGRYFAHIYGTPFPRGHR